MTKAADLILRQTSLSANIVQFCRFLRSEGFVIAAPEEADALRAIEILAPFESKENLRAALKTILTRTQSQAEKFENLFDYYWKQVEKAVDSKIKDTANSASKRRRNTPKEQEDQFQALKKWMSGNKEPEENIELHTFSGGESLTRKDFSAMTTDELLEMQQIITMLAKKIAHQHSRRFKANLYGNLDLRRTMRKNLRRGGELIELAKKKPQKRKLQLVLLCDVSRSMELYSRFLVHFSYAFQQGFRQIETFVFSSSLVKVSHLLRRRNFELVLEDLADNVPDWSGGTRIGTSLCDFYKKYGQKKLNSKTVVLILSDGWDMDESDKISESMHHIHRKARQVIWLNPLAGNPAFKASTGAMQAAMPYIDVFSAVHNLESLKKMFVKMRN
jgi:uncharacterized protein